MVLDPHGNPWDTTVAHGFARKCGSEILTPSRRQTLERARLSEADRNRLVRLLATIRDTAVALDGLAIVSAVRPRRLHERN
jgi:hypothetical protein